MSLTCNQDLICLLRHTNRAFEFLKIYSETIPNLWIIYPCYWISLWLSRLLVISLHCELLKLSSLGFRNGHIVLKPRNISTETYRFLGHILTSYFKNVMKVLFLIWLIIYIQTHTRTHTHLPTPQQFTGVTVWATSREHKAALRSVLSWGGSLMYWHLVGSWDSNM